MEHIHRRWPNFRRSEFLTLLTFWKAVYEIDSENEKRKW